MKKILTSENFYVAQKNEKKCFESTIFLKVSHLVD